MNSIEIIKQISPSLGEDECGYWLDIDGATFVYIPSKSKGKTLLASLPPISPSSKVWEQELCINIFLPLDKTNPAQTLQQFFKLLLLQ